MLLYQWYLEGLETLAYAEPAEFRNRLSQMQQRARKLGFVYVEIFRRHPVEGLQSAYAEPWSQIDAMENGVVKIRPGGVLMANGNIFSAELIAIGLVSGKFYIDL